MTRRWFERARTAIPVLTAFARDQKGATAIEYGLIAALLSVSIVTASLFLSGGISNTFNYVGTQVSAAIGN